jgi:hypothetical protein
VIGISPTSTSASEYLGWGVLEGWRWLLWVVTISTLRLVRLELRSFWRRFYRLTLVVILFTLVVILFTPQDLKISFFESHTVCGSCSDVTRISTDRYKVWGGA